MSKIRCLGKDCCTAACTFSPTSGATLETEQGMLVILTMLHHHLRLSYGIQPRELWWEVEGELEGKRGLYTLACRAEVHGPPRATLHPGDPQYYQPSYKN